MPEMRLHEEEIQKLKEIARQCRIDIVRMTHKAGSGHPGGSLSAIDILTVLFLKKMRHDPKNLSLHGRDRFIMSKGHASPAYYSILSRAGYIPEERLISFRKFGSELQGHPERSYLPFIDISSGGLGQGLSVANGLAHGLRIQGIPARVYILMGDGEIQEGQVWEAAMAAAHYRLDNLCAILDRNMLQIGGNTEMIMALEPLADKWKAFGWNVIVIDGHDIDSIMNALNEVESVKGQPSIIIAKTVKGKGVSFMENNVEFHGKAPDDEQLRKALEELGG
ncbi:MAG: transketolase [Acidobacteriota bacterium]